MGTKIPVIKPVGSFPPGTLFVQRNGSPNIFIRIAGSEYFGYCVQGPSEGYFFFLNRDFEVTKVDETSRAITDYIKDEDHAQNIGEHAVVEYQRLYEQI